VVDLQAVFTLVRFNVYASPHIRTSVYRLCSHNISVWNSSAATTLGTVANAANSNANWNVLSQRIGGSLVEGVEHDDILPTRAQYVMLSTNNAACAYSHTRVSEFEVYGTQSILAGPNGTLQNVARNKPAMADSTLTGYSPAGALDGITTDSRSRWVSTSTSTLHWFAVDLLGDYLISAANVVSDNTALNRGLCSYQIQVWAGVSSAVLSSAVRSTACGWVTIATQSEYTAGSTLHSDFTPIFGRLVRVVFNQTGCVTPYVRVFEIQIYGVEQPGTVRADGTNTSDISVVGMLPNVALNRPALADSVLGPYSAAMAFDNNTSAGSSRWVSAADQPYHWLAVDLGQIYLVQGIDLVTGYANSNGLCSHNVSVYMGSSLTPMATAVTQPAMWTRILLTPNQIVTVQHTGVSPPTYAQYVMLTVDQTPCGWDNRARVYEMAVYGSVPASPQTLPRAVANVALNRPAVSSSYLQTATISYPPANAFDGNTVSQNSRWVGARNDAMPWIAVDLQGQYTLFGASMVVGWPGSLCLTGLCRCDPMTTVPSFAFHSRNSCRAVTLAGSSLTPLSPPDSFLASSPSELTPLYSRCSLQLQF
jgi:hypothetical protein